MLGRARSAAIRRHRRLMREELEEPCEEATNGNEAFADRMLRAGGGRSPA